MQYRQLGKSGVRVSVIGLGTNRFGYEKMPQEEVNRVIDTAFDLGINFLDSADVYTGGRSEETIGAALGGPNQSSRRNRFVIATKFFNSTGDGPNDQGGSRLYMQRAVEASLRRLKMETIDLLYIHRYDDRTPIEETLRSFDDLISAGKIRYIGASQFFAWQLARANLIASFNSWSQFIVTQAHYHLLEREVERELMPYCASEGVGMIPFFPLAGGFLTGKYLRGQPAPAGSRGESSTYVQQYMTAENYNRIERLSTWAAERGHTLGDLAHAWLLAHPQVSSVISGATKLEQVQANVGAADWSLSPEEFGAVSQVLTPKEN
jgi:aryl-alcohol dehydrogenase-like predicted oxidoreductase